MFLFKKQLIFAAVALLLGSFVALSAQAAFLDRGLELTYPTLPWPGAQPLTLNSQTTLPGLLLYAFVFFVVVGGLIAFAMIVFAGFQFMVSGANPGMRAQAMKKIQNTVFGLILLLSAFIIFNTINPELTLLYTSIDKGVFKYEKFGYVTGIAEEIDYETLRYGGIVAFDDNSESLDGAAEKSETILHDADDIKLENFITVYGGDRGIASIKILGDCIIKLKHTDGSSVEFMGPPGGVFGGKLAARFGDFHDNVKGIVFDKKKLSWLFRKTF